MRSASLAGYPPVPSSRLNRLMTFVLNELKIIRSVISVCLQIKYRPLSICLSISVHHENFHFSSYTKRQHVEQNALTWFLASRCTFPPVTGGLQNFASEGSLFRPVVKPHYTVGKSAIMSTKFQTERRVRVACNGPDDDNECSFNSIAILNVEPPKLLATADELLHIDKLIESNRPQHIYPDSCLWRCNGFAAVACCVSIIAYFICTTLR